MTHHAIVADVLVCGAETDDDLRAISRVSRVSLALGRETVWAGSAGLAHHLPAAVNLSANLPAWPPRSLAVGPALIVIGSMSSVSRRQVEELGQHPSVRILAIPPEVLLAGPRSADWSRYALQIRASLLAGNDTAVTLQPDGPFDPSMGRRLSAAMSTMIEPSVDLVGALVASGGETARAILDLWGVTGLRILGELEPGLPIAVTEGWRRALPVLTKAGRFGNSQTLVHCLQFLQSLDRNIGKTHTTVMGA